MKEPRKTGKKGFTILHISDLHRSPTDPISNDELVSALVSDRNSYIAEQTPIPPPEAIVVSGDIIQGTKLGTDNIRQELDRQYEVAAEFLDELTRRFLDGDRSKVVLIPGNHDIDWNTAFQSMTPVPEANIPAGLASKLLDEGADLRWDWNSRTLYRITDRALYEKRLDAFWDFFRRFYHGVPGLLQVRSGADANLFELCDRKIGLAAFNSCVGNDCFAFHGMIRKEAIAKSHLDLDDAGGNYNLRIAVWHHNVEGPPYRTDYMDADLVRGMIGRGYRLGLYGHHHKAQIAPQEVWLPDRERMAVVSAGSLCAGRYDLPTGTHRQYNLIEIAPDFQSAKIHVRTMAVANLFAPERLLDFGGATFAHLSWTPPKNAVGRPVSVDQNRLRTVVGEAEALAKTGHPERAVALLSPLPLEAGSYQRRLMLQAAQDARDWSKVIEVADPPDSIEELAFVVQAYVELGKADVATNVLQRDWERIEMPASIADDLRRRIQALGAIRK
ncbi:metallophosphoesterase [Mesorhizobium sp. M1322]|uniref:metallophosphoesterase n=1 Tax=Mesorhizobium sp. M1322 TaxID=2957081 RepID=UPI0033352233